MGFINLFKKTTPTTPSARRVVGIDIGSSAIKVVELQERNGVVTLTTYGELQLGPYDNEKAIGQAVSLEPSIERQALVDVLRESAVKARNAVLSMQLASSFVTIMTIKATPTEDIEPRVRVEARKYIPVPIAEVTLDWAELETRNESDKTSRDILLAAIQNDALKRFATLMQTVEFGNAPTEIECFSAIRSLYSELEKDMAIIDIGATSIKLYLVRDGLLQRMYRVRGGGVICTEQISKELNISFEEAELLKRSVTHEHPQFAQVQKIHHNQFDRVLKEFSQVIEDHETRVGNTITNLYITGGGALFPGVDTYIGNHLSRSAMLPTPFNKVAYPAFMDDTLRAIGPSFSVALGAALRSFE